MRDESKSQKLELPFEIISNTLVRVTYKDTDQMGFAYYSNYLVWFEIGRTELFRRCGTAYQDLEKDGIILPVRHCECDYFKSARYDWTIRIETIVQELTRVTLTFKYNIYVYPEDELLASGITKHIFISPDGKIQRAGEKILSLFTKCSKKDVDQCLLPLPNVYIKQD